MNTTSVSLLIRVRNTFDQEAWNRFVDLYTPFLFNWGIRNGLGHADASDLTQDVLIVLAQKLPTFEYDPSRSFRAWLKTITDNRAKNFFRAAARRPTVGNDSEVARVAVDGSGADLYEEQEYRTFITQRLQELVQGEFREDIWQAFRMQTLEERPVVEIAQELGMSANSVYIAKSRVLRRIRQELEGLLD